MVYKHIPNDFLLPERFITGIRTSESPLTRKKLIPQYQLVLCLYYSYFPTDTSARRTPCSF